jgi:hypothetical protein
MGFSFRISEDEYVRSALSHVEGHTSSKVGLCIYFALAAICLHLTIMLTYGQIFSPLRLPLGPASALYVLLVGIITIPALWRIFWVPGRYSRIYRQSPALQSEMRVTITARGFTRDSDFGEPFRTSWDNYRYWREFREVFLLVETSNDWEFAAINTVELPDWRREELRELLNGLLPRR